MSTRIAVGCALTVFVTATLASSTGFAQRVERDIWPRNFRFASGESLDSLRVHVVTLGQPRRDFAGHLYEPGQPFDTTRFGADRRDGDRKDGDRRPEAGGTGVRRCLPGS